MNALPELACNVAAAETQLTRLFLDQEHGDSVFEIGYTPPFARAINRQKRFRRTPEGVQQAALFAAEQNAAGSLVYVGFASRRPALLASAGSSKKYDVVAATHLVFDCDNGAQTDAALKKADELGIEFSMVVETGATGNGQPDVRLQVYVPLDLPCHDTDALEAALSGDVISLSSNSNYGNALSTFTKDYLGTITRKTTVFVIGDGRNNFNAPHGATQHGIF